MTSSSATAGRSGCAHRSTGTRTPCSRSSAGSPQQSVYRRFHGFPSLRPETVEPFLDPDWNDRGSLIGARNDEVVALANYVRLRDPSRAEVAFAVADSLQGQGVGTRLLEQLAAAAAAAGISTFVAEVMPGNEPMLRVFADAGFAVSRRLEGGTTEVRLEIARPRMRTGRPSTSATTSPSPRRWRRSSRRGR